VAPSRGPPAVVLARSRGVIALDGLRVSRSLRQRLRRCGWETTVDVAFSAVVKGCAEGRGTAGTWISPTMARAYVRLHQLGWAHSVEVWDGATLIGGLYGVQVGGVFTGESMFNRVSDASKVALVDLAARFHAAGGRCSTSSSRPTTCAPWAPSTSPATTSSGCSSPRVTSTSG
jgi:leucyl/phenylalanyl-tRNA--protein transferase